MMPINKDRWMFAIVILIIVLMILLRVFPIRAMPGQPDPTRAGQLQDQGYWQQGYYIPGVISNSFYWQPPPAYFMTRALYQANGVLEETAQVKGYDTSDVEGLVALMSPATAGWKLWIRNPQDGRWWHVLDADAVAPNDYYYHVKDAKSAIELSGALAQAWGMVDYVNPDGSRYFWNVQVCIATLPTDAACSGDPLPFMAWFDSNVRFTP